MSFRLEHLPNEIQTCILSCLRHADLATLMRVSKSTRRLAAPVLWTHIELHRAGWHEHYQYEDTFNLPRINRRNKLRKHIELPSSDYFMTNNNKFAPQYAYLHTCLRGERFSRFLLPFQDFICPTQLDSYTPYHYVRSLCLDNALDVTLPGSEHITSNFWTIFSVFQNLESLEMVIQWPEQPGEWDTREQRFSEHQLSLPPLAKLRNLCLRGYIPQAFVRWALTHSEQLNTLELSILDRPISSSLYENPINPPPTRKQDSFPLEDIEDDGGDIPWVTHESDSNSESDEDLEGESVGPRALSICQDTNIPERLKSLSTLILTRPTQSWYRSGDDGWESFRDPIYCSIRSDKAILREWIRLIRGTRSTIQHLVLDQRPFCEEQEEESTSHTEFLETYAYGSGFQRFKEMVVPVLLEDAEWPALKSIRFYGFDASDLRQTDTDSIVAPQPPKRVQGDHTFLPLMEEHFEPLGVDVKSSLGRRMVFNDYEGTVVTGDGLGGQLDKAEDHYDNLIWRC